MLEYAVYDKTGAFQRILTANEEHVELLRNAVSFADLTFDEDDYVLGDLVEGSRVRVYVDGEQQLHGMVREWDEDSGEGTTVVHVEDDWRKFTKLMCWPKPSAAITAQTDEFKRYTGPTETVVKAACSDVSTRLGLGWTVVSTRGVGDAQRVEARFDYLADVFTDLVNADSNYLTWWIQNGTVDVTAGTVFPRTLTTDSGVLGLYRLKRTAPDATRAIVGGSGDGAARILRMYTGTAVEAEWADIEEVFVDSSLADGVTDLSPDANSALADASAKVTVSSELVETSWFRFGSGYHVGDVVNIAIGPFTATEVINKVVIDNTPDEGLVVVPSIGDVVDDADSETWRQIARLTQGQRKLRRR